MSKNRIGATTSETVKPRYNLAYVWMISLVAAMGVRLTLAPVRSVFFW